MERRIGLRARTDFAVTASTGCFSHVTRAIEISGSGIVLNDVLRRTDSAEQHLARLPLYRELTLTLPERLRPIVVIARPVRIYGSQEALRFVEIADVDRLNLAEHLDLVHRRGDLLN